MNNQQLLDYIKQQLQSRVDKENIKSSLLAKGWREQDIERAFSMFSTPTTTVSTPLPLTQTSSYQQQSQLQQPQPKVPSNKTIVVIIAVLVIAGALVMGFFYFKNNPIRLIPTKVTVNNKTLSKWSQITQIGDKDCHEVATKDSVIFISCEDHLYKSYDSGNTWETDSFWGNLNNSLSTTSKIKLTDYPRNIVFDDSGNIVYAASIYSGIYRSKDQGKIWQAINNGVRTIFSDEEGVGVSSMVISPSNNKILYAQVGDYTLIKTEDGGETWQMVQETTQINGLAVDPQNPNRLYLNFVPTIKSEDGGKTLITDNDMLPVAASVKSYYVNPDDFQNIIVAGLGGVFVSRNGGQSWEPLSGGLKGKDISKEDAGGILSNPMNQYEAVTGTGQKWINSIAVNPKDTNLIAVGTETEGVIISKDGGKTWSELNQGLTLQKDNAKEFIIVEKIRWSDDGTKLFLLSNHGAHVLE